MFILISYILDHHVIELLGTQIQFKTLNDSLQYFTEFHCGKNIACFLQVHR